MSLQANFLALLEQILVVSMNVSSILLKLVHVALWRYIVQCLTACQIIHYCEVVIYRLM
jgi:hypothetical protein